MNEYKKCGQCKEPSKRLAGFWDAYRADVYRFDCDNQECPIKQERERRFYEEYRNKIYVAEENRRNGVDLLRLADKEAQSGTLLVDRARHLGIGPAEYCYYSMGKKPMPPEFYQSILMFLDSKAGTENRREGL